MYSINILFDSQQKAEQKQTKLRQQNSLQLNSVPSASPTTAMPRSDSSASVNTGERILHLNLFMASAIAHTFHNCFYVVI